MPKRHGTAKEALKGRLYIAIAREMQKHPNMHPDLLRGMVLSELDKVLKKFQVSHLKREEK